MDEDICLDEESIHEGEDIGLLLIGKKGDKLGEMTINVPGRKPIVIPLVAEIDVDKINPFARIFAGIKYLVFGTSLDEL